jgi:hypothetical protein
MCTHLPAPLPGTITTLTGMAPVCRLGLAGLYLECSQPLLPISVCLMLPTRLSSEAQQWQEQ